MAGDHDAQAVWQRYAPWQGTYRALDRSPPQSPRARRLLWVLFVVWLVVVVSWAVELVREQRWSGLAGPLVWALLYLLWCFFSARRPAGTRITAEGLAVRRHPFSQRSVPWDDVVEVQPRGRYDDDPAALLSGGERLPLVGVPAEVAEAMAAVTRPETEPARRASPAPHRPEPGEDLDGPFHRGPGRR